MEFLKGPCRNWVGLQPPPETFLGLLEKEPCWLLVTLQLLASETLYFSHKLFRLISLFRPMLQDKVTELNCCPLVLSHLPSAVPFCPIFSTTGCILLFYCRLYSTMVSLCHSSFCFPMKKSFLDCIPTKPRIS